MNKLEAVASPGRTGAAAPIEVRQDERLQLTRLEQAFRNFSAAKRKGANGEWLEMDDRVLAAGLHCLEVWTKLCELRQNES